MTEDDQQQPSETHDIFVTNGGDFIAATPFLLGFHPQQSLVLIVSEDCIFRAIMRSDLPSEEDEWLPTLRAFLRATMNIDGKEAMLIVVGGGDPDNPEPPFRDKIQAAFAMFRLCGVQLHALWTPHTLGGQRWCCYQGCCEGIGPEPQTSQLAALSALKGIVTYSSREQLAARLEPADPDLVDGRFDLFEKAKPPADQDPDVLLDAIRVAANGQLPSTDDEILTLVMAMADTATRDLALGLAAGDQTLLDGAVALFIELTRGSPEPFRALPASVLAALAFMDGDGALYAVALDVALEYPGVPSESFAKALRDAPRHGMTPDMMRGIALDTARETAEYLEKEKDRRD